MRSVETRKLPFLNGHSQLLVRKLFYIPAVGTNQVMMCTASKGLFVLGKLTAQLMLNNQLAFLQQIKGIVNRSPANPIFRPHGIKQSISIKMAFV